MAEIAGIFAVSHAPPIVREWDAITQSSGLADAFAQLGNRIGAARPDVIVAIGADHWANFFLDNMPAICVGVGDAHRGPPEPWLAEYPHPIMTGHAQLGLHIAESVFQAGFEPSLSYDLKLDHAFCVPLWKAGLDQLPPIVPIIINALQPPLPSPARCLEFGSLLANAIEAMPGPMRVVILATGGLSHSVGEPTMGEIDEAFDREALQLFAKGDPVTLLSFLTDERMAKAGNGTAELRFWLAAHGAARSQGFELIHYEAVAATYTGCGFAEWRCGAPLS
jgi:aromatic ring-opening dioxygenase catalytic subunit (LigB family)